eukprot:GHVU01123449.1.p1 GENE.GHVU01123449.1~~GHVU01123449.1.p1  ORF type:complete len:408 (-),score=86.28 GHVU01123449.1:75-1298(-)
MGEQIDMIIKKEEYLDAPSDPYSQGSSSSANGRGLAPLPSSAVCNNIGRGPVKSTPPVIKAEADCDYSLSCGGGYSYSVSPTNQLNGNMQQQQQMSQMSPPIVTGYSTQQRPVGRDRGTPIPTCSQCAELLQTVKQMYELEQNLRRRQLKLIINELMTRENHRQTFVQLMCIALEMYDTRFAPHCVSYGCMAGSCVASDYVTAANRAMDLFLHEWIYQFQIHTIYLVAPTKSPKIQEVYRRCYDELKKQKAMRHEDIQKPLEAVIRIHDNNNNNNLNTVNGSGSGSGGIVVGAAASAPSSSIMQHQQQLPPPPALLPTYSMPVHPQPHHNNHNHLHNNNNNNHNNNNHNNHHHQHHPPPPHLLRPHHHPAGGLSAGLVVASEPVAASAAAACCGGGGGGGLLGDIGA